VGALDNVSGTPLDAGAQNLLFASRDGDATRLLIVDEEDAEVVTMQNAARQNQHSVTESSLLDNWSPGSSNAAQM